MSMKTDHLSAQEFRELFKASGSKVSSKGRPIIDIDKIYADPMAKPKGNRKVKNAEKVYGDDGEKLADSKWEYRIKSILDHQKIGYDFQRKFELLPTLRREGQKTMQKTTWTPDFTFEDVKIVADAKGHMTEMGWMKIKMFSYFYPDWDVIIINKVGKVEELIAKINMKKRV